MNNSPIVKCSHCNQILASEDFDSHKCEWNLKDVKRIPVVYFQDDSYEDQKIIRGYGIDGIVYTLVVTPRTAIPFIKSHLTTVNMNPETDDKLPEPGVGFCEVCG